MRLLVLADYYLPGWKAGGPIRSISNMVEALGARHEFLILTRDHDYIDHEPYPNVRIGAWNRVGRAAVYYYEPSRHLSLKGVLRFRGVSRLICDAKPDVLFANSLFSPLTLKALMLRRTHRIERLPILIAPRGELGPGAMRYKRLYKRCYLAVARMTGLFKAVQWQASTPEEASHIRRRIRGSIPFIAADIPQAPESQPVPGPPKTPGSVRVAFTARISPMKNLPFLLRVLQGLSGEVALDLYGAAEVAEWAKVDAMMSAMPANVSVTYHGAVSPNRVGDALAQAHFSALPTRGENFGHSIYEALRVGRPVIVSDRAPWRGLEQANAGWSLPLESDASWTDAIQRCIDLDEDGFRQMVTGAHSYAVTWYEATKPAEQQATVLEQMVRGG